MGRKCFICHDNKPQGTILHQFPSNRERYQEWVKFCNVPKHKAAVEKRICSIHFTEECFVNPTYKVKGLRPFAVPTLYPTGIPVPTNDSEPEEEYIIGYPLPEDMELAHESTSKMDDKSAILRKTEPPLRLQNIISLQTIHKLDEESPLSIDTGSTLENDNLIIFEIEMEEQSEVKDEPIVIKAE